MKYKIMKNHIGYFIKGKVMNFLWISLRDFDGGIIYFDTKSGAKNHIKRIKESLRPPRFIIGID